MAVFKTFGNGETVKRLNVKVITSFRLQDAGFTTRVPKP